MRVGLITAIVLVAGFIGVPDAAASQWRIQNGENPVWEHQSELRSVACASSTSCTAVGDTANPSEFSTLAEGWNGTTWAIEPRPLIAGAIQSHLLSVACPTATTCEAVGYFLTSKGVYMSLAEQWSSGRWTVQATPNPTGANPSYLYSVSCPTASLCTAVGLYENHPPTLDPLIERFTGGKWILQQAPNPNGSAGVWLSAVSCPSTTACTAVGYRANSDQMPAFTLAERWNGTTWAVQSTANPTSGSEADLTSISCPSTSDCTAVGNFYTGQTFATLAEQWNGTAWKLQSTPNGTQESYLDGVSCPSAGACTSVGGYATRSFLYQTLAEGWNGMKWTTQSTPNPASQTPGVALSSVSCTSASICTAVGNYYDTAGRQDVLAERYS